MTVKPTYEELAQRVKELEKKIAEANRLEKAGNASRESEEKFRSLVENAPNFISILDHDGTIQFVNRTVPGLLPEEVIGEKFYDHADPEYHTLMKNTVEQVFRTGRPESYCCRLLCDQTVEFGRIEAKNQNGTGRRQVLSGSTRT